MKIVLLACFLIVSNETLSAQSIVESSDFERVAIACLRNFFDDNKDLIDSTVRYSLDFTISLNSYVHDSVNHCIFVQELHSETVPASKIITKILSKHGVRIQTNPDSSFFPFFRINMRNCLDEACSEIEIGCVARSPSDLGEVFRWKIVNNKVKITDSNYIQY